MKKSIFLKVGIFFFIVIISIIALVVFSEKVQKIEFVEYIKQAINEKFEKTEDETYTVSGITKVDVTNLEDKGNIEHEHTFKTMYDENKHWEECTSCGEKYNEVAHSYTRILADETLPECYLTNYYDNVCSCGYSYRYKEPCVWDGTYIIWADAYGHVKRCKNCKDIIYYSNYYDNGVLKYDGDYENCMYSSGSIASCKNFSGTCTKCGNTCTSNKKYHVPITNQETGVITCKNCYIEIGKIVDEVIEKTSDSPSTYVITTKMEMENWVKFNSTCYLGNMDALKIYFEICNQEITEWTEGTKTQFTLVTTAKFKREWQEKLKTSIFLSSNY